jgi:uncharacterized protein YcbK (DUF882 family)
MAFRSHLKNSCEFISKNFQAFEFDCPCKRCKETIIDYDLPALVQKIRDACNCPVQITSGYRCGKYQDQLRAEGLETSTGISQHEKGRAADIWTGKHSGEELEKIARRIGFRAVGVGKAFIHVDLRDDKDRRWTYHARETRPTPA